MAKDLFLQPHLSPTTVKLQNSEFMKIWDSISSYLSQQLALHQAVHISGLGTFAVVREQVASKEKDLVVVERPVFQLAKTIARDYGLQSGCTAIPGHQHVERLPYAQIASDNSVSKSTVQLCLERTMCLFRTCLENRKNTALVWRDVGMLIVQGKDAQIRFYTAFLSRLNGTDMTLQAVLGMPEMRDSIISCDDTAASQTSSGCIIVLPRYKLETIPNMLTVETDLTGQDKDDGSGKKGDLAEKHLLHRARLSPKKVPAMTMKSKKGQKAELSKPHARQLPASQRSSLKKKEEKAKLTPLAEPRMNKHLNRQETFPEHIQKYLDEEEKKKTELEEEKGRRQQTQLSGAKAKGEKEMQRSQESSSSEQASVSSLTGTKAGESSSDLLELMMGEWEEAGEEPAVHEEDTVPSKQSLSPQTHQVLWEVVTCILEQVARKRRGQRDDQTDLQDKLKCELAVLQWHQSRQEEAGPQPSPPARPGKRRVGPETTRLCLEEEGSKIWESLHKKCQQRARAKVATVKGLARKARMMRDPGRFPLWLLMPLEVPVRGFPAPAMPMPVTAGVLPSIQSLLLPTITHQPAQATAWPEVPGSLGIPEQVVQLLPIPSPLPPVYSWGQQVVMWTLEPHQPMVLELGAVIQDEPLYPTGSYLLQVPVNPSLPPSSCLAAQQWVQAPPVLHTLPGSAQKSSEAFNKHPVATEDSSCPAASPHRPTLDPSIGTAITKPKAVVTTPAVPEESKDRPKQGPAALKAGGREKKPDREDVAVEVSGQQVDKSRQQAGGRKRRAPKDKETHAKMPRGLRSSCTDLRKRLLNSAQIFHPLGQRVKVVGPVRQPPKPKPQSSSNVPPGVHKPLSAALRPSVGLTASKPTAGGKKEMAPAVALSNKMHTRVAAEPKLPSSLHLSPTEGQTPRQRLHVPTGLPCSTTTPCYPLGPGMFPRAKPTPLEEQEESVPITAQQRSEKECMKKLAQEERERAALQTSLGQLQFFVRREIDLQIANDYGYL